VLKFPFKNGKIPTIIQLTEVELTTGSIIITGVDRLGICPAILASFFNTLTSKGAGRNKETSFEKKKGRKPC